MPDGISVAPGGSLRKTYTGVANNSIIYVVCTISNVDAQTNVVATGAQEGSYPAAGTCQAYLSFAITGNTDIYVYGDPNTLC